MSLTAAQIALMKRVATMPDAPGIVWPNGPGAELPRFVMQASGGAQRTGSLAGRTDATPEIVVRVETVADAYSTANDALVTALVARFRPGDQFDGVTVIDAPNPRPALPVDGGVYSVPVIIRGRTHF